MVRVADSLAKIVQVDNDNATDITPEKAQKGPLPKLGSGPPSLIKSVS